MRRSLGRQRCSLGGATNLPVSPVPPRACSSPSPPPRACPVGATGIKHCQGHPSRVVKGGRGIPKELPAWRGRQRTLLHGEKVPPAPRRLTVGARGEPSR